MKVVSPERLRLLTVDAHPRGLPHLGAASGLVCAHGRVYVIADDEHHLAVFADLRNPGRLHRIVPGDLPRQEQARKKLKPDLETLLLLPSARAGGSDALVALGSGSRQNRQTGVVVVLGARGEVAPKSHRFDLRPIYEPLRGLLGGEINIEGAVVTGDRLLLLNRAVRGKSANAVVYYELGELRRLMRGARRRVEPERIQTFDLGDVDGVALGFTDAAPLPGGGWVFTAAAEDTADSVADGLCAGSVVGVVDGRGSLRDMWRLRPAMKVEGVDLRATPDGLELCLVTDADDPDRPSALLRMRLGPTRDR